MPAIFPGLKDVLSLLQEMAKTIRDNKNAVRVITKDIVEINGCPLSRRCLSFINVGHLAANNRCSVFGINSLEGPDGSRRYLGNIFAETIVFVTAIIIKEDIMPKIKTVHGIEDRKVVSREEWLKARVDLLKAEKELTRHSDDLARKRQELPWVKIDKEYQFDSEEGKVSLADLFKGRSQLLIYHFMFGPDYKAGCPHCSAIADGFNAFWVHLANHDVMLSAVSRAPLQKLQAYKQRLGWTFPWVSSHGSDFNYDFNVSFTQEQQRTGNMQYNYDNGNVSSRQSDIDPNDTGPEEGKKIAASTGTDWATFTQEAPGMSAFVLEDGILYHTYSTYARGLDGLWGIYQWLDRAPLGRNEGGVWMRRHDEYDQKSQHNAGPKDCCA